jgi:hypothetical protein
MANKPERSRSGGTFARSPAKLIWLGEVEALDEAAAIDSSATRAGT